MPVVWDAARYARYYGNDWRTNLLAPSSPRFASQFAYLVSRFGLTPDYGLVLCGDGYGGLGEAAVNAGWPKENIQLTEDSAEIINTWGAYGSKLVDPPVHTNSYDEANRLAVRAQERASNITHWWCIVADCSGDDADVTRWAGLSDPDTGYISGNGQVIQLITTRADWEGANQEPDNVWDDQAGWGGRFLTAGLADVVVDLNYFGAPEARGVVGDAVEPRAQPPSMTPFTATFPYYSGGRNPGPYIANARVYMLGKIPGSQILIATYWRKQDGGYVEIGGGTKPAFNPAVLCGDLNGDNIETVYVESQGDTTYFKRYLTGPDQWDPSYVIHQAVESGGMGQPPWLGHRSNGERWALVVQTSERIMGTGYPRAALYSSLDGEGWALRYVIGAGEQIEIFPGALCVDANDNVHFSYTNYGVAFLQTIAANDDMSPTYDTKDSTSGYQHTAVATTGRAQFIFRVSSTLVAWQFSPVGAPSDYARQVIDGQAPGSYATCPLNGDTAVCMWTPSDGSAIWMSNDQGVGSWIGQAMQIKSVGGLFGINQRNDAIQFGSQQGPDGLAEEVNIAPWAKGYWDDKAGFENNYDPGNPEDVGQIYTRAQWWPVFERRAAVLVQRLNLKAGDRVVVCGGAMGWLAEAMDDLKPGMTIVNTDISPWILNTAGTPGYETRFLPVNNSCATYADRVALCDAYFGGLDPTHVITDDMASTARFSQDSAFSIGDWPNQTTPVIVHFVFVLTGEPQDAQMQADNPSWTWMYLDSRAGTPNWRDTFDGWGQPGQQIWSSDAAMEIAQNA